MPAEPTIYATLRSEIAEGLNNRERPDLIARIDELTDDEIAAAASKMVADVEHLLDARKTIEVSYEAVLSTARGLVSPGDDDGGNLYVAGYRNAVVELIVDLFGLTMNGGKPRVAADLGVEL